MKFIPKYITTDILAEYGEHLTHEAYNEMVKLNSSQGDYNSKALNQLFNTDEGIQIPYLDKKIKEVTDDQAAINEDMEQVVADMAALAGSLSKYSTIIETRRMIQYATQDFVKTNKIKAGENVEVEVDALNNVIISATGGGSGDVTKAYVDEQDATTLQSSKDYTDTKISQIPIPVVPTDISAFNNDVGYITGYTETDPIFSASAAAGITSDDITSWNGKSDFSGNYADLSGKPDLSVYVDKTSTQAISGSKLFTTIPQTNQTPTANHHITNKEYVDGILPVHYLELSSGAINILGLKKGIYVVKPYTNSESLSMYYSPFRTGQATYGLTMGFSWFYVLTDITDNLATNTPVMELQSYSDDGICRVYTVTVDNTQVAGVTSTSHTIWETVGKTGAQVINGTKTFNYAPKSNRLATGNTELANRATIYRMFGDTYASNSTYNTGDVVEFLNELYICNEDSVTGAWDSTKWTQISSAPDIYNRLYNRIDPKLLKNLVDGSASGSLRGLNTLDDADPNYPTYAIGQNAVALGYGTRAEGANSFAGGAGAWAESYNDFAFGSGAHASGGQSVAFGSGATASGSGSFALGNGATATGSTAVAIGQGGTVAGSSSFGLGTSNTVNSGAFASAAIGLNNTIASTGQGAIAMGYVNTSSSYGSVAEGMQTTASNSGAHAEGGYTTASGTYSHAEGQYTVASGTNAHAEGSNTEAGNMQHAEGFYNLVEALPIIHMVGNGSSGARSNAYTLDQLGNGWFSGDVYVGSTSGTHRDSGSVKLLRETVITPVYNSSSTYAVGDRVMYDGALYTCNTAITTAEDWTAAHWTQHTIADSLEETWFFDPNKQGAFGTADTLHFLNCNRYQSPFILDGKQKGMYVFAPMGFHNGSQLEQCFKGTSAATTYLSVAGCCFLVIVKEYANAATEEDIAFGWGFGINGPMTFSFKKDTTAASGLKRTNMDYYNTSLYVSTQGTETIGGTKTFSAIPRVSSTANPNNIAQLLSYNAFMGLLAGGDYNVSNTYNTGQYTRYNNRVWQCKADNVTGFWDATKWTDLYGTSLLDSVIDYVDNKYVPVYETYPTTETRVGTWIDGKPIYRTTIDVGQLPDNSTIAVSHNIADIKYIVRYQGIGFDTVSNNWMSVPFVSTNLINVSVNTTAVNIQTTSDRTGIQHCYITIDYTKTTD